MTAQPDHSDYHPGTPDGDHQNYSTASVYLKGICMGTADVIPGVSGGTLAFILGIYPRFIAAIKSFDLVWIQAWLRLDLAVIRSRPDFGFVLPLLAGIISAMLFFTRVVPLPVLLRTHPEQVYGLFFGLIGGSIVVLLRSTTALSARDWGAVTAGLVVGLIVFNLTPTSTSDTAPYIFLAGCLAICAMMLPGISGSFILLILDKYTVIFNAIGYFSLSVLLPFVLGMLTGLAGFSRVLAWLMRHYQRPVTMVITGLLLASLWVIWPFQIRDYVEMAGKRRLVSSTPTLPEAIDSTFLITVMLAVGGLALIFYLDKLARKKTHPR